MWQYSYSQETPFVVVNPMHERHLPRIEEESSFERSNFNNREQEDIPLRKDLMPTLWTNASVKISPWGAEKPVGSPLVLESTSTWTGRNLGAIQKQLMQNDVVIEERCSLFEAIVASQQNDRFSGINVHTNQHRQL